MPGSETGYHRVLTPGFLLLVQSMTGILAATLSLAVLRAVDSPPAAVLDAILSALLLLTILKSPGSVAPLLLPGLGAAIPLGALYLVLGSPPWFKLLLMASIAFRAYVSIVSLAMIASYWKGISLGSDSTLVQLALVAALVVLSGAILTYVVESRDPRSPIRSLGDAVWWALATATTVGYGDVVPVTTAGRVIASLLMIFGIGSLGIFISDMAARIVKLALLGIEGGSVIDREKAKIMRSLSRLEKLSDAELELLISKLRLIHAITRGAGSVELLDILDSEEPAVEATA